MSNYAYRRNEKINKITKKASRFSKNIKIHVSNMWYKLLWTNS